MISTLKTLARAALGPMGLRVASVSHGGESCDVLAVADKLVVAQSSVSRWRLRVGADGTKTRGGWSVCKRPAGDTDEFKPYCTELVADGALDLGWEPRAVAALVEACK